MRSPALRVGEEALRVGPNSACPYAGICFPGDRGFELTALDALLNATADPLLRPNLYSWHEYIYENPTLTETLYNTTRAALVARRHPEAVAVVLVQVQHQAWLQSLYG